MDDTRGALPHDADNDDRDADSDAGGAYDIRSGGGHGGYDAFYNGYDVFCGAYGADIDYAFYDAPAPDGEHGYYHQHVDLKSLQPTVRPQRPLQWSCFGLPHSIVMFRHRPITAPSPLTEIEKEAELECIFL